MKLILVLVSIFQIVASMQTVPVLVASHKLVPGLKNEINSDNLLIHNLTSVTNMIKKLISSCSSDAYLIINQPGLTLEDLNMKHIDDWGFLRKYLTMSSTVVGLPYVNEPLDLPYLEKYIIKNCQAETINVDVNDDEVGQYYDTRTRVIRTNLSPLPTKNEGRYQVIREHDEILRKILRILPSPHFTIILTSDVKSFSHPVARFIRAENPNNFEIFNDIVNDPARKSEVERNDRFHKVDPQWNSPRHSNDRYLENKKKDEIHLFDYDLWFKNEKLVLTIAVMILSIFIVRIVSLSKNIISKISEKKQKPGLIGNSKKRD